MGGEYPVAVVNIPVDDPKTQFVAAALFEPTGAGPFPAVIILSGCAGVGPDAGIVRRVNADYLPKGIATLVVDSFTPRDVAEVCSDSAALFDAIVYRVEDSYAAIAWLGARPEIDSKHVFLQGYSHGAMTAIEAIHTQRLVPQQKKFAGVIAFYPLCYQTKFPVPTIVLIGAPDDWTPAKYCQMLQDEKLEVSVYPKAFHDFPAPGVDRMYLGHHITYDEEATNDAQRRALAFIESLSR